MCEELVGLGDVDLVGIDDSGEGTPEAWFRSQPVGWRIGIRWAVLDMSGPYRTAYDRVLPNALQVADPFHVIRLANQRLDEDVAESRTKPWGTGALKLTRCIGYDASSPQPTNGSATGAEPASVASSTPVIPTARYAPPGTARKPFEASTRSTAPPSRSDAPCSAPTTSGKNPAHRRSTNWNVLPAAEPLRSLTGTPRR
ncbi:MAG: transposase [Acidimicrobiia bacterium]|nr:transposase [Acidimicrobiia bacterium]